MLEYNPPVKGCPGLTLWQSTLLFQPVLQLNLVSKSTTLRKKKKYDYCHHSFCIAKALKVYAYIIFKSHSETDCMVIILHLLLLI